MLPSKLLTAVAYRLAELSASGTVRRQVSPGVFLDLNLRDWFQRLYYLDQVDRSSLRLLKSLMPVGGTFVDVGAYVGLYTCVMANHVGPTGCVLAFEPMPQNVALLRRNIELNGFTNVEVQSVALSNQVGTVDLYVPLHPSRKSLSIGPSSATRIRNPGGWSAIGSAPSTTLDRTFHGGRLDLIKIDVQGHEAAVLEGAHKIIERFRPVIVCEVETHNRSAVIEFAATWDYDLFVESSDGRLSPRLPEFGVWFALFLIPR